MSKSLSDMTLEELWKLFPIEFTDSSEVFKTRYQKEERMLNDLLGSNVKRISHVGSTSMKHIKTKPIVDVLVEIDWDHKEFVKDTLLKHEYMLMAELPDYLSFNKGYTINGYADEVFHIHVKPYGDCDEIYFRDYLNAHEQKAKEYEQLKMELYHKYQPNRDLYTDGKEEFVREIVRLAKEKFQPPV